MALESLNNFLARCARTVCSVSRALAGGVTGQEVDYAVLQIDSVMRNILRLEGLLSGLDGWDQAISSLQDMLSLFRQLLLSVQSSYQEESCFQTRTQLSGQRGRPRYNITLEQLEFFIDCGFTVRAMASMLHVSDTTIHRRMRYVCKII